MQNLGAITDSLLVFVLCTVYTITDADIVPSVRLIVHEVARTVRTQVTWYANDK